MPTTIKISEAAKEKLEKLRARLLLKGKKFNQEDCSILLSTSLNQVPYFSPTANTKVWRAINRKSFSISPSKLTPQKRQLMRIFIRK